jgi:Vacuolar sorting-associated protein 13, N-terminal
LTGAACRIKGPRWQVCTCCLIHAVWGLCRPAQTAAPLLVSLDAPALRALLGLSACALQFYRYWPHRRLRPAAKVEAAPALWWQHAARAVQTERRAALGNQAAAAGAERRLRRRYQLLYALRRRRLGWCASSRPLATNGNGGRGVGRTVIRALELGVPSFLEGGKSARCSLFAVPRVDGAELGCMPPQCRAPALGLQLVGWLRRDRLPWRLRALEAGLSVRQVGRFRWWAWAEQQRRQQPVSASVQGV